MIVRFKERKDGKSSWQWSKFPNKVALQLNDTHSTLAIPELMRLLMDDDGLGWDEAWDVTTRTIAYTNHTVLPEALEKCSQAVMWKLLPHHMEIIEEIDKRFIAMIRSKNPELESKLSSMRVMDKNPQKLVVRMANLCVVSSHTVNGVAQLHSDILKSELFADYVSIWPKKFQNKTNDFQAEWESAKMDDKQRLAQFIFQVTGVSIDPNSLFDSQFKWIHEYKRQLLNILGAIYRYKKLKDWIGMEFLTCNNDVICLNVHFV
ncbi:alpha-glucan phosphorylase, H isozyme-like isoform X1 [Camellia sinensis]|uniref:alpha-glucan phosphorylase, H isozyme-like isoform X1 n=1 Tax=Camellia sinensis TaxID=4442 RepID=UPI00103590C0|nr:alpha-glucan phosphorylase, H isozyme-like isoform X1 [Camellia sinensis]